MTDWTSLKEILTKREKAQKPTYFWWRDDDAFEMTESLQSLIKLSSNYEIPLHLAVIPELTKSKFCQSEHLTILQHGINHNNNQTQYQKKIELGGAMPLTKMRDQLLFHHNHLKRIFGESFFPVLVPPWNRAHPILVQLLENTCFKGISTHSNQFFKRSKLPQINTHIDLIEWKSPHKSFIGLTKAIHQMEQYIDGDNNNEVIGLLTHHKDHDESLWVFLEQLFNMTSSFSHVKWIRINDIIREPV